MAGAFSPLMYFSTDSAMCTARASGPEEGFQGREKRVCCQAMLETVSQRVSVSRSRLAQRKLRHCAFPALCSAGARRELSSLGKVPQKIICRTHPGSTRGVIRCLTNVHILVLLQSTVTVGMVIEGPIGLFVSYFRADFLEHGRILVLEFVLYCVPVGEFLRHL